MHWGKKRHHLNPNSRQCFLWKNIESYPEIHRTTISKTLSAGNYHPVGGVAEEAGVKLGWGGRPKTARRKRGILADSNAKNFRCLSLKDTPRTNPDEGCDRL